MEFTIYEKSTPTQTILWEGKRLTIGRRDGVDIRIDHPTTSGLHAEIIPSEQGIRLRDLDSRNGTHVNGIRVVESLLRPGDQIKVAGASIVVSGSPPEDSVDDLAPDVSSETSESWNGLQTDKLSIQLDRLRATETLDEDRRILLLRDLFEALRGVDDADEVLSKVREVMRTAFPGARTFLLRPSPTGRWCELEMPVEGHQPSSTFASEAASSDSAILSSALREDQRFSYSESVRISGIQTAIATPIRCLGNPVAVLYVDRLGLPPFTHRDLHLVGIAANHVSAVLENVTRIADLRRTNAELDQAHDRLARLNRNLEQLVAERTAEIRRQADKISHLAKAKDELLGIAAHDIRGPLTVIQGTVELMKLRRDHLVEATLNRSLDLIHEAARGLSQLLSELLDVKAIESGKITVNRIDIPVAQVLESFIPAARLSADDKKIDLEIDLEPELMMYADPQRMGQTITNLLLNAVKFSKSGTRILIHGRRIEEGGVEISVEDQGIGIPEEELEQIFDSFRQGSAGRAVGGSGLGLVIARRLVELHGGELSVKSRVGVGTRFMIRLLDSTNQRRAPLLHLTGFDDEDSAPTEIAPE